MREWLNRVIAIPLVALLRDWLANEVVTRLPFAPLRHWYFRRVLGVTIGKGTHFWRGVRFTGGKVNEIVVGAHCSIPWDTFFVAGEAIRLGDHVVLGHGVEFYTSDHDPDDPAFSRRDAPIVVGDRAWIGSRSMILKGVTIGEGAVVAAGSLVTTDIEPYHIVAGRPARFIRMRGTSDFTYSIDGAPWYV